jgi:Family of unknown function (DUF5335)
MTKSRTIPKAAWQPFFDSLSAVVVGKRAEIEVASLDIGDQIVAEWLPLLGMTYDPGDDLLDIAVTGLNHLIRRPRQIVTEEGDDGVELIAVISEDDTQQVVRLKEPLMLSPKRETMQSR